MTYDYRNPDGRLLFQVVRGPGKKFTQRRPNPAKPGEWLYTLQGVQRVLYRLPEVLAAAVDEWVLVVEGEKDADRLASEDLVATTNPGGAGNWRTEYGQALAGRKVAVLPDKDEPGLRHAHQVAASQVLEPGQTPERLWERTAHRVSRNRPGSGRESRT